MAVNDFIYMTGSEQARLLKSGALSPVELMRASLERIDQYDPKLRAWITVNADQAMAKARVAEQEISAGKYRGPLHGLPFGV